MLPSGRCSPWPHGLQFPAGFGAGTRKGRLERSEWGETRVAEGASARGDGENPEPGAGGGGPLKNRGGGSGPGGEREEVGAKERAGRREIAGRRGLRGMGAGGSRGMGAGAGCWRWRGSRALGLIVRELRAREGSPELEKGLGVLAEALMGPVLRGLTWGI